MIELYIFLKLKCLNFCPPLTKIKTFFLSVPSHFPIATKNSQAHSLYLESQNNMYLPKENGLRVLPRSPLTKI